MPNTIGPNGLQIKTASEIYESIVAGFKSIYGDDINVASDTPDGQMINIFQQAVSDALEQLAAVNQSFDVDMAFGKNLDARVALNGLQRTAGTYTYTDVDVTATEAVNLKGLDGKVTPDGDEFTVYDNAGHDFILAESQVIAAAGTNSFSFRAKDIGAVETTPNTITNVRTITLGITVVNNPTVSSEQGVDEETDAQLRLRHARMFYLASTGPADSVQAALLAVDGVTDAYVVENVEDTEQNGVPAHGIWPIVEGGEDADIAAAIYAKKGLGCDIKGDETYDVTRPNGLVYVARWDRPVDEDLYVRFGLSPLSGNGSYDADAVKEALVAALSWKINQVANIGQIILAMQSILPNFYLTTPGVSLDGSTWEDAVVPSEYKNKFVLTTGRITIS